MAADSSNGYVINFYVYLSQTVANVVQVHILVPF